MNLFVLWVLLKLKKEKVRVFRLALGAGLGAFAAVFDLLLFNRSPLLRFFLLYAGTGTVMIRLAFPYRGVKRLLGLTLELYLTAFLTGGLLSFLYYHMNLKYYLREWLHKGVYGGVTAGFLAGAVALSCLLLPFFSRSVGRYRETKEYLYPVELCFKGKIVRGMGFLDSGNHLLDPCTGEPVMVGEWEWMKPIFPPGQAGLPQYAAAGDIPEPETVLPVRLIPFHSIGKESGVIPAIRMDWIKTEKGKKINIREKPMVAIYQGRLSADGAYQLLLHSEFTT